MSNQTLHLNEKLYHYLLSISLHEPTSLKSLREATCHLASHGMQISPEQGQFMRFLIELIGATKTLELGVYTGYSALAVALALPETGKIIACDINKETTSIAQHFWQKAGVAHKIDLKLAPALETLDNLIQQGQSNRFDFIFIDADKLNYLNYYERSFLLLRPGGLMLIDNVLWSGKVADSTFHDKQTRAIRAFNQAIYQDKRISMCLIPISDGLTLIRKR
ncbi:SAM-dependent methyltransferase [Rickettsiella grylli]|uniref:class I SAM-dependent methyltransferase n=1 Tax=Rickettsiella grylli TaxID=59196 RepID=UPI0008FD93F6|nr:class I SAM-dependent methyltransferase [Rickettsiella grylli]OJA00368.1 SAM-dependent methyltransferase [Rickettsiella grylli]